ncbi:MAG: hypothetical protein JNL98_10605 [Bryobacterales bacterium]|nr:hypothetical protein [Bryobacterales bacterium]
MTPPVRVDELEIIGYSDVLDASMLPSAVPPVFRNRARRVLVPPFFLRSGYLYNATEISQQEADALRNAMQITLFEQSFPAVPGHELWIDQSFQYHYEPADQAKQKLFQIADDAIREAESALLSGDWQKAERISGMAYCANDRRMEPLAIEAAIRRLQGNRDGERLMKEMARPFLADSAFESLIERYCHMASPHRRRSPIAGMALERPKAA